MSKGLSLLSPAGAGPPLQRHEYRLPHLSRFRKVGTTDLIRRIRLPRFRWGEGFHVWEAPRSHRPMYPPFENREGWGSLVRGSAKLDRLPVSCAYSLCVPLIARPELGPLTCASKPRPRRSRIRPFTRPWSEAGQSSSSAFQA